VGHHGSDTATSPAFLTAVNPKYAVIEVGTGNDYGHPHAVTLQKLAAAGVTVYRTDLNGTVTITSNGSNLIFSVVKQ
jgi:competence protein ComEC